MENYNVDIFLFVVASFQLKINALSHSYQMFVRNKLQKFAIQVMMPHGVIGCSEVHKDSTSLLFSREILLDFFGYQGDLIYSRSSASEACLFLWEQRVDDRLNAGVNEPFEDLVGNAKQRDLAVAFSIIQGFVRLGNSNHQRTSPNFWNPDLAQAGRENCTARI